MKDTLLFFTNSFPFGNSENFIENEIIFLSERYKKVYVFPFRTNSEIIRWVPRNVEVIDIVSMHKIVASHNCNWYLKKHSYWILTLINRDLFSKKNLFNRSRLRQKLVNLKWLIIKSQIIYRWIKENKTFDADYYSFWLNDWATILGVLKTNNKISDFYSRAHGYDLYKERNEESFKPFRKFHLKSIKKIFVISKKGAEYLKSNYPIYKNKIFTNYLGTNDFGLNKITDDKFIYMVSVSNVIALKRLHLIIEIIDCFKKPVKWVHFGEGDLLLEMKILSKHLIPKNIIEFRGQQDNSEVIKFLSNNPISFFLNTSKNEGIPVSIMEATSFGIPIVATDVGSVDEIVNSKTGILIPANFNPEKIAIQIENKLNIFNSLSFRKDVRKYWLNNFFAKTNYESFIKNLN